MRATVPLMALLMVTAATAAGTQSASAAEIFADNVVYASGQPLLLYGTAESGENLIIRLRAPDGAFAKFDQIEITREDGTFNHVLLVWPQASTDFPYGTYAIEIIGTVDPALSQSIDIRFAPSSDLVQVPIERSISTLVFAPETAALGSSLRVFVQTTSDGLLIEGSPNEILDTSHIHLPDGTVQDITESFDTLHRGLHFVDYTPRQLGTYIFHVVAFHQGTTSHGSVATTVMSQDIESISEQIIRLNSVLNETSTELGVLKAEIAGFGSTLEGANQTIDSSVRFMSASVDNIVEASLQLNSLLFPIVGSIAIIVALQIAILARRR